MVLGSEATAVPLFDCGRNVLALEPFGLTEKCPTSHGLRASICDVWPDALPEPLEGVTQAYIRRVLRAQPPVDRRRPTLEEIVTAVAFSYGASVDALRSAGSREHRLSEARAMAGLLVREAPHLTLSSLSRYFERDPLEPEPRNEAAAARARREQRTSRQTRPTACDCPRRRLQG